VSITVREGGQRKRANYVVQEAQIDKESGYWVYQLSSESEELYKDGEWVKESDIYIRG
jgi:hypothetical protein